MTWPRRSIPAYTEEARKNKIKQSEIANKDWNIEIWDFDSGIMVGLVDTSQYTKLQQG